MWIPLVSMMVRVGAGSRNKVTRLSDEDDAILRQYAYKYWDELGKANAKAAKVVQIYKDYNKELQATKVGHR